MALRASRGPLGPPADPSGPLRPSGDRKTRPGQGSGRLNMIMKVTVQQSQVCMGMVSSPLIIAMERGCIVTQARPKTALGGPDGRKRQEAPIDPWSMASSRYSRVAFTRYGFCTLKSAYTWVWVDLFSLDWRPGISRHAKSTSKLL